MAKLISLQVMPPPANIEMIPIHLDENTIILAKSIKCFVLDLNVHASHGNVVRVVGNLSYYRTTGLLCSSAARYHFGQGSPNLLEVSIQNTKNIDLIVKKTILLELYVFQSKF